MNLPGLKQGMCGRGRGSPTEGWRDRLANLAEMAPCTYDGDALRRNCCFWTLWKNNLRHQEKWQFPQVTHWAKNSLNRWFYSSQWERERTGKKWFSLLLLGVLNNETHRQEGRVAGSSGWTQEGNQMGHYLEPSRSNFLHDWDYSTRPSIIVTTPSECHLSCLLLSPPLCWLPPFLKNRCIMCD